MIGRDYRAETRAARGAGTGRRVRRGAILYRRL